MRDAIFLSASVPDEKREPEYARTSDSVAISSAVHALLFVVLGRRPLIWGGHPAITPMVVEMCNSLGVDYQSWVYLYQSLFFEGRMPSDNDAFDNVILTERKETKEESLRVMRRTMLTEHDFLSAVFIGGMSGILDEFQIFSEKQPTKAILPIYSTGGASLHISTNVIGFDTESAENLDYVQLFHTYLNISPSEPRIEKPSQLEDSAK